MGPQTLTCTVFKHKQAEEEEEEEEEEGQFKRSAFLCLSK
jgi:hypothetical protein